MWNNGSVSQDIDNLTVGSYDVFITDANSCTTSTSIVLSGPTPLQTIIVPSTDYNGYEISCNGYSDGGIDLTVSGSVPFYGYLWNTGSISQDIDNLTIGSYDVFITDANSCTTSTSIILDEPTPLVTSIICH